MDWVDGNRCTSVFIFDTRGNWMRCNRVSWYQTIHIIQSKFSPKADSS
ncbi:hypothetical protein PBCV1_A130aR [Paramecium bursaria Chlorella virus 1]|uniref:Uncharacterized protein n=1 Tax=Paramecium bursaria Chlorella virus 1 TaxID=10506 RepID=F8TTY3_PBCV1|nr:hypothetical protein PBCV1_A130aR [Paramecium bursaria Chlorella virus 1]AEI70044.1 hypothetical protein [Paramecium bursaria Chlorella virus 1]